MANIPKNPEWRLTLDIPHTYAVEPGFARATHSHDFRPQPKSRNNVWREPTNGILMLNPSFLTTDWYGIDNWRPLTEWAHNPRFWSVVNRGNDPLSSDQARFFSTIWDQTGEGLIEELTNIGIAFVSAASTFTNDIVIPVLQSNFVLAQDEAFVCHYRGLFDELHRFQNWFSLDWDTLQIHFHLDGSVRVLKWDDATDKSDTTTLRQIDEFEIASPGDLAQRDGYFIIIPMPTIGIGVYHSRTAQKVNTSTSSASAGVSRGHIIPFPTRKDEVLGTSYLLNESKLTVAVAADLRRMNHMFGFHAIRFAESGSFLDDIFDPGYYPSHSPDFETALVLPTGHGTVTATLHNAKGESVWDATKSPPDRQGRLLCVLSSASRTYTPFVMGTYVSWFSVRSLRNTTPVEIFDGEDRLWSLEFSDDHKGHFEGSATIMVQSEAARLLLARGESTFRLEKSFDGGATWKTHAEGMAVIKGDAVAVMDAGGMYFQSSWALSDMSALLSEVTKTSETAYDRLSIANAISQVLIVKGFPALISPPAIATNTRLPAIPPGQNWRFSAKAGDTGLEEIKTLLLFLRKQYVEYDLNYDFTEEGFKIVRRPYDTSPLNTWTFSPFQNEMDEEQRVVGYGLGNEMFRVAVQQPEGNIVVPYGVTSPDANAAKVMGVPLKNYRSLNDPLSPDYLGRFKYLTLRFDPISEKAEINKMARRLYDAACHRRLLVTTETTHYRDKLGPNSLVKLRGLNADKVPGNIFGNLNTAEYRTGPDGQPYAGLWVKRRTVSINYNDDGGAITSVSYQLDSLWEDLI